MLQRLSPETTSPPPRPVARRAAGRGSPLPQHVEIELRAIERCVTSIEDPVTALEETIAAIWRIVERVASDGALDPARHEARALLARRGLVHWGTAILSAVICRGVAAGTFRPRCASWAIERLPFAIVWGACMHWVFGLSRGPSLRARAVAEAALGILSPPEEATAATPLDGDCGPDRAQR